MKSTARMKVSERAYLQMTFELTELMDRNGVEPIEVEDSLGIFEDEAERTLDALVAMGLLVWPAKGLIMLTEQGLSLLSKERVKEHPRPQGNGRQLAWAPVRPSPGSPPPPT